MKKLTKKVLIGIGVLALSLGLYSITKAGDKELTFNWEQTISTDFAGWNLYMKADSTGNGDLANYTKVMTIPYSGSEEVTYEQDFDLNSPDGEVHTYYFVLTAFDTSDNESDASNEVDASIDFEKPSKPSNIRVVVKRSKN